MRTRHLVWLLSLVMGGGISCSTGVDGPIDSQRGGGDHSRIVSEIGTAREAQIVATGFNVTQVPLALNMPYGGRATAVTINPSNASIVIAATEGGGLFKSINAGASWVHIDSFVPNQMTDVRFSPNNSNIVVASALGDSHVQNKGGLWTSTDGGTTWTKPATADPA